MLPKHQIKHPSLTLAGYKVNIILAFSILLLDSCRKDVGTEYAGSESCQPCHKEAYANWEKSHHASAEQLITETDIGSAFIPNKTFRHGSYLSTAILENGNYTISTTDKTGNQNRYITERILGVDPLIQFIIPFEDGRYQVTELAYDPNESEWFNVFGEEDRQTGEWGHWMGRGMNWNSMCAPCHNTGFKKNYTDSTDSYNSTVEETGVGCEACHGPLSNHVIWQEKHGQSLMTDTTIIHLDWEKSMSVCGSCHSRRGDMTGSFTPGKNYFDHYIPIIPDETDIYYPDGQVREENYEYISYLGSKMYNAKIHCQDCHSIKVTETGNTLCEKCHNGKKAPIGNHSNHLPGTPGSFCVDCHMPVTIYMQRDLRHDHGFTIPDPWLTNEHGVPNACNKCHADKSIDWSIVYATEWYGDIPSRPTQIRARIVAEAHGQNDSVISPLIQLANEDSSSLWRAVAAGLLKQWAEKDEVVPVLLKLSNDRHPLVRLMSIRSLETVATKPDVLTSLTQHLLDPIRSVRVEAAWVLRRSVDITTEAGKDLLTYLDYNSDQPNGALQSGLFHLDRDNYDTALPLFRKAVLWDPNSASLRYAYAVALSRTGETKQSITQLEKACNLEPANADYHFYLGLAYGEDNNIRLAIDSFHKSINLDPEFARAWYNLGLAYMRLNKADTALSKLVRAEELDPTSPLVPYTRATILLQLNRLQEAQSAAHKAIEIDPNHSKTAVLINYLNLIENSTITK